MELTLNGLKEIEKWNDINTSIPKYDIQKVKENTKNNPTWLHFGAGNIFRIFIGGIADKLLNESEINEGIICAETFDFDIIEKIYKPYDNLVLAVTLKSDGSTDKKVLGSLTEALKADEKNRLKEIFACKSLQIASFTITEKGYALKDLSGEFFQFVKTDLENEPEKALSAMPLLCSLLLHRYKENGQSIAILSMDNCSHNGEKLQNAVMTVAEEWNKKGFVDNGFMDYLKNKVSFPWSMIDKITPRPSDKVCEELKKCGLNNIEPLITSKNTYIAPFVNAEEPQYLVIEDNFPNGRPPLEKAGVYMTDRKTVNDVETMKVTTCLNPLHTALAVYGCLLGYTLISDEMKDKQLVELVNQIGIKEGMPVVIDPVILSPEEFVKEVLEVRFPNPFMPDAPQRIATDTSQKVGIRFGETIKSYVKKYKTAQSLNAIPLAIAGWLRYLLAIDDEGNKFELSADPMLPELTKKLDGIEVGKPQTYNGQLKDILTNKNIFGVDLFEAGVGEKIENMFVELIQETGSIRKTLIKYLG